MTKQQLELKLREAERRHRETVTAIKYDYMTANNSHKVGDIVTDALGSITIEKITYSFDLLCAIYTGREVKKDGTLKQRNKTRSIYQKNLIT